MEISLQKTMLPVFMTSNQCLYHFDNVHSRACLPSTHGFMFYLKMLSLNHSLQCRMLLGLINNKLGGMWTELAVAYIEVGNILAIVVARNELCIKLIRRK